MPGSVRDGGSAPAPVHDPEAPARARISPDGAVKRTTAAAALLVKLPLRSQDLRRARLDRELIRDSEAWRIELVTSKTGARISGALAPCLEEFLDAAVLLGADPADFRRIYARKAGAPLFANHARDGTPCSAAWLYGNFRTLSGHGPHIVRTLMFDACVHDADLDIQVAAALSGHSNDGSAKRYEHDADRHRREEALRRLGALNDGLAAGRRVGDRTTRRRFVRNPGRRGARWRVMALRLPVPRAAVSARPRAARGA